MRKFLVFICFILAFTTKGMAKETTYTKELFDKALSDGKVVVVSSWIKYCTSCASQMKVLDKAKNDYDNIEYFTFDVTNKEIAEFFNIQYQTTLLIFKDNKEVYRSIGETTKELIYDALNSVILINYFLISKLLLVKKLQQQMIKIIKIEPQKVKIDL